MKNIFLFAILLLFCFLNCGTEEELFDITYWKDEYRGITFTDWEGNILEADSSDWWWFGDNTKYIYWVHPAYPNPIDVDEFTTIRFNLPKASFVEIEIRESKLGVVIKLMESQLASGVYSITWNAKNYLGRKVPPSVYRVEFKSDGFQCKGDIWVKKNN